MRIRIYRLADGRLWDTARAAWIGEEAAALELDLEGTGDAAAEGGVYELVPLLPASGEADEACLARTLDFYGYGLGALAGLAADTPEGIKRELARLDAEYLTARTLAGLATGDAEALSRWHEHEEKAAPLRLRYARLTGEDGGENEAGEEV